MAAPKYAPNPVLDEVRTYASPDVVPAPWSPDRPGDLDAGQPTGERLGYQGPDQGYALSLARRFEGRLHVGELTVDDAVRGCLNIALKRASMFGRAPVIHDLTIAFTMWGFLDPQPPADLVARRRELFDGVGHLHHYKEGRAIADLVPESTLRLNPAQVTTQYRTNWRELTGA